MYKRIAYLAPELPSLSATFVTNEIWALESRGAEVVPFSIHRPHAKAHGAKADALAQRTTILYETGLATRLASLAKLAVNHKRSFARSLGYLLGDVIKTGVVTRKAIKLMFQYTHGAHMATILRQKNVEHLHIHFAHVPTQVGMYAASLAGLPFTFMSHANDLFERPLLIPEKVKRAKQAVTISQFNIDLMSGMGADPGNMGIVRCGVHGGHSETDKVTSSTPFTFGTLGRMVEKKGMDTLLDALAILKSNHVHVRLEIAGDGPLRSMLEIQVNDLGLQEQVHFLGALPHADVMKWMQKLDGFVLAARKDSNGDMDGIPVVLMEAMTLGIPVISTALSGIPELVIQEETGLLATPADPSSLANCLTRMVEEPQSRRTWIAAAKQHVSQEFDSDLNARRLLDIIHAE